MNDSSDDEYAPIEATVWGSQATATTTNTTDEKETKGWDSLVDPDVKVGPNDLGSGQLHRRGGNFKPIGEELILAQRLNKPVAKKAMQLALRKTEAELGLPIGKEKTKRNNTKKKSKPEDNGHIFSRKTTKPTFMTPSNTYREVPSTTRVPVANGGNKWLQTSLVDTPFWEQKDKMKPISNHITTTNTRSASDIPNVEAGFTMIQLEPKSPMHNGKGRSIPPTKVEPIRPKVVNDWANAKNSWGAVSKEIEPFINSGWDSVGPSSPSHSTSTAHSTIEKQASDISGWGDDKSATTTNDWSTGKHPIDSSTSGWGVGSTTNKSPSSVHHEPRQQQSSGWGVEVVNTSSMGWNEFTNNDIQPSSQPSWLNSQPNTTPAYPPQPTSPTSSRFSNPSKQRYSANIPMNAPKPINYRPQQKLPNTLPTAPPPPPENSILVTIYVEISETVKIPVNIHELDEPLKLARDFAENNKISAERIVSALTDLFTKQKDMALKVKQQKLRRRVPSQQQSRSRYYGGENNNLYTNSPSYPQHKPVQPFGSKDYY